MTLFQISEPGESPLPHATRRAVGIDLGTTNSLVATVRNGSPVVLPDVEGRTLLPSVVRYGDRGVDVGHTALAQAGQRPGQHDRVREAADGARHRRPRRRSALPYRLVEGAGMVRLATALGHQVAGARFRPRS